MQLDSLIFSSLLDQTFPYISVHLVSIKCLFNDLLFALINAILSIFSLRETGLLFL